MLVNHFNSNKKSVTINYVFVINYYTFIALKNPVNTGDNSKMVPEAGLEPARGLNLAGF